MKFYNVLIVAVVAAVLAWCLSQASSVGAKKPAATGADDAEKIGWRLGAQAWTFRRGTFFEAVDRIAALGMKYVEMYPGQRVGKDIKAGTTANMSPEVMAKIQAKLKASGVKLVVWGVAGLPGDEAGCRKVFEWARKMGIEVITTEPAPKALPMLDKLCKEYGLKIALHNHPKPSRYWSPDVVLAACKGLSNRIGACADTGHWARSGLDPIECLKKLQGRVVSFHFKDLSKKARGGRDVPWGTGACDAAGMLAEMRRRGFKGIFSMEYEARWTMDDLAKCVTFFHAQAAKLAAVKPAGASGKAK